MNKFFPLFASVMFAACAATGVESPTPVPQPQLAPIALASVRDSVMYLERTESFTLIERATDTLRIVSTHDAVVHVIRTAPDTLEAFYEHLLLRFETPTNTRNIDTDAITGPRFVLHDDDGRISLVSAPPLPNEIRQLTDLRRQFDDFFLRLPEQPLSGGLVWVDTVRLQGQEGEATTDRSVVTRFTVRGDTVVEGLPALVIDYDAVLDYSTTSAPTTEGRLLSRLIGEEEGWFVYSPAREVMLRRWRVGLLEGELVIQGNLEERRFPQSYGYESTIELIPPALPGASRRPAAPPAEPPAEL